MCGIFGYCGKNLPEEQTLFAALNTLTHRGPDQAGSYEDTAGDLRLWLGHRRLSILDLSEAGKQPFVTPDGKVAAAVNGEIYNVSELRPALEAEGAVFRSHSDSELLLWGFYFEGEAFFQKMRGMFACAIWDRRHEVPRLILLRDRQGIKPMHYRLHGNDIAFASELKAIGSLPGFQEKIDRFALDHYFVFGYIPSPLTIYENTFKVRPGEYIVFENGKIRKEIWWKIRCPEEKFKGTLEDAVDELDRLVNDAVSEQLAADVPLGAFLSGGIDSSLICAVAQKQMGTKKLKTFTIGFETEREDESRYARTVADFLGTDHTCQIMSQDDLLQLLGTIPAIYDEPYADSSAFPTFLLSRLTRKNVTTALSGDGGDELFFGYNNINALLPVARLDHCFPRPLRLVSMDLLHRIFGRTKLGLIGKALSYDRFDEAALLRAGIFHRVFFDRLTGYDFSIKDSILRELYNDLKQRVPDRYMVPFLQQALYMPDDVLCKVDRASMACSLEVRPPLLDHRIAEFANSLPFEYKHSAGTGKIVMRKLLARYIPEKFWERPKQGFSVPMKEWFQTALKREATELFRKENIQREGLLDPEFVQTRFTDHLAGKKDNGYFLWTVFCWEKWLREIK